MNKQTPISQKIPPSALPQSDQDRLDWLRLLRSRRVGPATFIRLVREHGSVRAGLAALPEIAQNAGVNGYELATIEAVNREFEQGQKQGARLLCLGEPDYPPLLATISDAPPVLWAIGDLALATQRSVAMVGARNASSLGRRMAKSMAEGLGQAGFVVTSGLARGVDAAAHLAALSTGTIAVLAGGVDVIYPPENAELAAKIAKSGLILSEMPMGTRPQARHFPRRNRIISGLSCGVVVVEGAARSGSLITARDALDQGREVMAVPGNPMDARAAGCNMLIRDGAMLVRGAADVISALQQPEYQPDEPIETPVDTAAAPEGLSATILSLLGPNPVPEDTIIREIDIPAQRVLNAFADLELAGKLVRHTGGMVACT